MAPIDKEGQQAKPTQAEVPQAVEPEVPAEAQPEAGLEEPAAAAKAEVPSGPVMQQCLYCARYFEEAILGLHHDVCKEKPAEAEITPEQIVAHSPADLRPGEYFMLRDVMVKKPYSRRWLEERCDVYEHATSEARQHLIDTQMAFWRVDYYHSGDTQWVQWNGVPYLVQPGNNHLPNVIVSTLIDSQEATAKVWRDLSAAASRATNQGGNLFAPGAGFLVPLDQGGEPSGEVQVLREV